jgi:hypothetical protein
MSLIKCRIAGGYCVLLEYHHKNDKKIARYNNGLSKKLKMNIVEFSNIALQYNGILSGYPNTIFEYFLFNTAYEAEVFIDELTPYLIMAKLIS